MDNKISFVVRNLSLHIVEFIRPDSVIEQDKEVW